MIELDLYRDIRRLYNEGHSQRQIARILGCCRKTIRKYCRGALPPDARASRPNMEAPLRRALEKEISALLEENKNLPRKQRRNAGTSGGHSKPGASPPASLPSGATCGNLPSPTRMPSCRLISSRAR